MFKYNQDGFKNIRTQWRFKEALFEAGKMKTTKLLTFLWRKKIDLVNAGNRFCMRIQNNNKH